MPREFGRVVAAFAILLAIACGPVFSTVLPPLVDYPNHLARMHLIGEGGNAYYAVRWAPLPNLAADLIIPPLARLMPLMLAGKVFLVLVFALIAGGTVWLNRVVTGRWRRWPLLAFLFLYNRILLWGFINYLFGVGVALCSLALWLGLEQRRAWLRLAAASLAALACFFSHIEAFGLYGLTIVGVEAGPAWREFRRNDWRNLARRLALIAGQFAIPGAIFFAWWAPRAAGGIGDGDFARKADLLFSVFDNYNRPFDIFCFLLLAGAIGVLAASGRLHPAPRLLGALALVLVAYLALPSRLFSGSGVDHRLPLALFLLLIAASAPSLARREAIALAAAAAMLFAVRIGVVESVWRQADRTYAADLAVLDHLPVGAKLAVAYPAGTVNVRAVPQLHLPTLAVARREAFVPTLFAYPGQQPLAVKPPFAALADAESSTLWWLAFIDADAAARTRALPALMRYDDIVFLGPRPFPLPADPCLAPVAAAPSFRLAAIVHGPGCAAR